MVKCDFCQSSDLVLMYNVHTSRIGAKIFVCSNCSLVQSKYGEKSNKHNYKSISSDADWGNVRHGKKIRLEPSLNILKKKINFGDLNYVMDVGSNRGHFVNYITKNYPRVKIFAIEPDSRILDNYINNPNLSLYNERFENCNINSCFELIYCCHTLEHADSASKMINKMSKLLTNSGYLFIDVPSISVLNDPNGVEEFFIDKHTFHFSLSCLINYLNLSNFKIIYKKDDGFNISILAQKIVEVSKIEASFENYKENKISNRKKLLFVSKNIINISKSQKTLIWGASKIFDALIKFGNLKITKNNIIVDDYLYGYIDNVHGHDLNHSSNINFDQIDCIILLTRSATDGLKKQILKTNFSGKIVTFDELIKKL